MRLIITRSKWDLDAMPFGEFVQFAHTAGFDGTEIHLPSLHASPEECHALHEKLGMAFVAMITTEGKTVEEHCRSLEERYRAAIRFQPILVNCHTGRDIFTLDENLRIFRTARALEQECGITICHETHRGRATYSAIATRAILAAMPEIRLNADLSHWCCVHESLLQDQEETVAMAIGRSGYIHARVGHMEGPQVSDPRAPEWSAEVEQHMLWWERIAADHVRRGASFLAVCPEFGPAPYMPALPFTRQPVTDINAVVIHMMHQLRRRLQPFCLPVA
jgi:sugar phosphate isomerase/epimerase